MVENGSKSLGARVFNTAEKLNIPQTVVHGIINSFFNLCRLDVIHGKEVYLFGFVRLVPDVIVDDTVNTTAMYCREVAKAEGVTYVTAREVVRVFLECCKQDLIEGRQVVFRTFASLRPQFDENGGIRTVHVSKASSLARNLLEYETPVTSVKASACKFLINSIQQK